LPAWAKWQGAKGIVIRKIAAALSGNIIRHRFAYDFGEITGAWVKKE